ncbi:hypothetical protein WJX74_005111 [Apatococcus lobatus]|uniref:RING-type domain-containing protein n=1 Tax=Apatococcus lobatus TaxID=904363 RepID=A0AAW1Q9D0_9CHLO
MSALPAFDCPVCLRPTLETEAAYLLPNCWHRFCAECIQTWTETQRAHPAEGAIAAYSCPLCKAHYASYVWDSQPDKTFQQTFVDSQMSSQPSPKLLDPETAARRAMYYATCTPPQARNDRPAQLMARAWQASFLQRSEVVGFVARELRALLPGTDVDLLTQHVQGVLVSTARQQGPQVGGASWRRTVASGVGAFLQGHAMQFADELWAFIVSGMSLPAYSKSRQEALQRVQRDTPIPSGLLRLREGRSETSGAEPSASQQLVTATHSMETSLAPSRDADSIGQADSSDDDKNDDAPSELHEDAGREDSGDYDFLARLPSQQRRLSYAVSPEEASTEATGNLQPTQSVAAGLNCSFAQACDHNPSDSLVEGFTAQTSSREPEPPDLDKSCSAST